MTDFLAGLVSRGQGRALGPALTPRLAPQIVGSVWQRPALPSVDSAPSRGDDAEREPPPPESARREVVTGGPALAEQTVSEPSPPPAVEQGPVTEAVTSVSRARPAEPPAVKKVDAAREPAAIEVTAARSRLSVPARPPSSPTARPLAAELPAALPEAAGRTTRAVAAPPPEPATAAQTRRHVQLRTHEPLPAPPVATRPAREASHRVEVRIGRLEVRPLRAPEPIRSIETAPARGATAGNPFADLAAARRYVDRAWR